MDVILTIGFKITTEMEIRKHTVYVLRPTSQMRRIGFVKQFVLLFIHCQYEMC